MHDFWGLNGPIHKWYQQNVLYLISTFCLKYLTSLSMSTDIIIFVGAKYHNSIWAPRLHKRERPSLPPLRTWKRSLRYLMCHLARPPIIWQKHHFQLFGWSPNTREIMKPIQGVSKRWVPSCEKIRWSSCVLLPAVGKQNATFSSHFTQPGKSLLVQPCTTSISLSGMWYGSQYSCQGAAIARAHAMCQKQEGQIQGDPSRW